MAPRPTLRTGMEKLVILGCRAAGPVQEREAVMWLCEPAAEPPWSQLLAGTHLLRQTTPPATIAAVGTGR